MKQYLITIPLCPKVIHRRVCSRPTLTMIPISIMFIWTMVTNDRWNSSPPNKCWPSVATTDQHRVRLSQSCSESLYGKSVLRCSDFNATRVLYRLSGEHSPLRGLSNSKSDRFLHASCWLSIPTLSNVCITSLDDLHASISSFRLKSYDDHSYEVDGFPTAVQANAQDTEPLCKPNACRIHTPDLNLWDALVFLIRRPTTSKSGRCPLHLYSNR